MEYKYWGCVEISKADGHCKQWIEGRPQTYSETPANRLPAWAKNKIVLLNFMEDTTFLPCESHKVTYSADIRYYLYKSEDVSSAREEGGNGV